MIDILFLFVQIITESLPISSSGHVWLVEQMLIKMHFLSQPVIITWMNDLYNAPTLLVFSAYFFKQWTFLLRIMLHKGVLILKLMAMICLADGITLIWYMFFHIFSCCWFPHAFGFCITGLLLYSLKFCTQQTYQRMTYKKALLIGCAQGIALLPGISRMAITYSTGCFLHLTPRKSFLFSCALQVPLISAALLRAIITHGHDVLIWTYAFYTTSGAVLWIIIALIIAYLCLYSVEQVMYKKRLWKVSRYMFFPFVLALFL
ncbi:MAG: undecaprenyl-diphosphate phosphatase [Candidatus Babeliaceae bacterium]